MNSMREFAGRGSRLWELASVVGCARRGYNPDSVAKYKSQNNQSVTSYNHSYVKRECESLKVLKRHALFQFLRSLDVLDELCSERGSDDDIEALSGENRIQPPVIQCSGLEGK